MVKKAQSSDMMEKIVSLCKRRGFIFAGSEIYGGLANTYDYGPRGVEVKNNIKNLWWQYFVQSRDDMTGLDGGILMSPKIWEASGHAEKFKDPLVECKKCHHRFRPDKLADASRCPDCGGAFTAEKFFSGMFKTTIGPVEEEGLVSYLRPETAQTIFVNYKNVLDSMNKKIPFGIGQMGKAFRNEITTGNFIFRTLEFEQMEIEYFISPTSDWNSTFESWTAYMRDFMKVIGLDEQKMHNHEIPDGERAFYSKRTIDMEYDFPFGQDELWAIAYRADHDLNNHQKHSGQDLRYFDQQTNERYVPHVIEPTFGVDRTVLAVISEAYKEEEAPTADGKTETRVVLKFNKKVAPVKVAVLPLSKKEELSSVARDIYHSLRKHFVTEYDETQSIGKRYRRQDEIGTPYCVTVDFDSLEDGAVTVRERDSMRQDRVAITELSTYLTQAL